MLAFFSYNAYNQLRDKVERKKSSSLETRNALLPSFKRMVMAVRLMRKLKSIACYKSYDTKSYVHRQANTRKRCAFT